jgi:transcriptional regulator with XRE-family HTH domain
MGRTPTNAKLTPEDVKNIRELVEIRERYKRKAKELSQAQIAQKFDVSVLTIQRITTGKHWRNV